MTAGRPNKKRCWPRLNWHVERVSTDKSGEYRPALDWQSTECRSILSTESRSTDALNTHDLHNPPIGAYSFKPYSFVPHKRGTGNILLGCAVDHRSPIFIRCLSWICLNGICRQQRSVSFLIISRPGRFQAISTQSSPDHTHHLLLNQGAFIHIGS